MLGRAVFEALFRVSIRHVAEALEEPGFGTEVNAVASKNAWLLEPELDQLPVD